jgi:hypothetical protein
MRRGEVGAVIEARDLTKRYAAKVAVDHLSFTVRRVCDRVPGSERCREIHHDADAAGPGPAANRDRDDRRTPLPGSRRAIEGRRCAARGAGRAHRSYRLPPPARHGPDAGHPSYEGRRGDRPLWLHDVAGKRPGGFPLGMPEEAMHRLAEPAYAASMRDAQQTSTVSSAVSVETSADPARDFATMGRAVRHKDTATGAQIPQ